MNGHIHQPGVFWRLDEPTILQLLKSEGVEYLLTYADNDAVGECLLSLAVAAFGRFRE